MSVLAGLAGSLAVILFGSSGHAQLPSQDQINQAAQQFLQQRQGQGAGYSITTGEQNAPQSVTLQPAVPQLETPLPPSRLEQILSTRAGVRLRQFGYDQLGRGRSVTVPLTGAVQDDYVLGPGDEIVVSLRGQENGEFRTTVDRNGQVVLPRLSPIPASGRSFGSFRQDLDSAIRRAYVATNASVSVGRVRQISVLVSGEVNNPGQRLLTGLSSAVDALLLSGGVKKTGSLRNVRIQRGGREYTVDLYNVLTTGGSDTTMRLTDGDRILVPPLGRTAAVAGLVRQPGIFELPARASSIPVRTLLSLAGGQEVRGRYRLSVLRVLPDGRNDMTQLAGEAGQVGDSEILFVQLGADQVTSQATLAGSLGLAGSYPIVTGTRLSDVLKAPGALGASPYTPFGVIVRKDPATLMPTLLAFTPVAVLAGHEDMALQSDDLIRPFTTNEVQMLNYIVHTYLQNLGERQNAIRNPLGQSVNANNTLTRQLAAQSGQGGAEIEDIASVPANIQRQQINLLLEVPAPGSDLARQQDEEARAERRLQVQQLQPGQQPGLQSQQPGQQQPGQQVSSSTQQASPYAPSLPGQGIGVGPNQYGQAGQYGPSSQSGQYGQYDQYGQQIGPDFQSDEQSDRNDRFADRAYGRASQMARNFSEQSVDPGRFAANREVQTFGQLARQLGVDPLVLINFLVDRRVRLDGAVRGPGYYFVGPNVSLNDLVQAAGGTVNWADQSGVELISTAVDPQAGRSVTQRSSLPLRQGMLASYIVHPRDQFRFGQIFSDVGIGSITVQGEVRNPGTFPILRGEHLSDVLARAGGLTGQAYPYGTVFLRQSVAQMERDGFSRAADEVQNQLVVAMTRVGNDKIDPGTFASMQSFVSELRNQRALGRISVAADPSVLAANPNLDPLLESGDVIYVPPRPSTISVLGQVLQPGSYPYKPGRTLGDYIDQAGGYSSTADSSQTFIVLPDGSARRVERSWLSFSSENLPPGSAIVVPRDVTPLDMRQVIIDVSQIFSQLAVSIASVAVLSRQ
ncbi:MAG TPA: SLBB domain-containing protein [Rhizomicrobium sp.]|nr:SLBB domain-containing protein [Rhizomicrobium sp.]